MKISVSSYSFSEYMRHTGATYTDICDLAVRLGFEGIEFTDLSTEVQPAEDVAELASQLGEFCSDINLPVVAYTVWADFLNHDPEQELERLKEYVDTAVLLKAPVLRHDVTWTREGDWKTAIDYAAPYIRRLAEYAAERGVFYRETDS